MNDKYMILLLDDYDLLTSIRERYSEGIFTCDQFMNRIAPDDIFYPINSRGWPGASVGRECTLLAYTMIDSGKVNACKVFQKGLGPQHRQYHLEDLLAAPKAVFLCRKEARAYVNEINKQSDDLWI
jgi:hypothetical protein